MTDSPTGQIITFYSYKGGTGRTMALANVAWILAANGKRVLVADWDLESPGLHRFFRPYLDPDAVAENAGIIDMIRDYEDRAIQIMKPGATRPEHWVDSYADVTRYAMRLNWDFEGGGYLDFLSAGRQNGDYAAWIGALQWDNFYDRLRGGEYLDRLRDTMKRNYDYVLIDSRTGLSDVADVCTIHLPDTLVVCFTLSDQGILGAAKVAATVRDKYGMRNIRILPVPMRVDPGEQEKADAGRTLAVRRFAGLPANMTPGERQAYWSSVEVPYRAFYAYEETLATFGDAPGTPNSLLGPFEMLTRYVTDGSIDGLPPMDEVVRIREVQRFRRLIESGDDEVGLVYAPADAVWAEWIESVLATVGIRVSETAEPRAGRRTVAIISSPQSAPLVSSAYAADTFAVYVTDARPLPQVAIDHSAFIGNSSAAEATDRVLRLLGRSKGQQQFVAESRFPGDDTLAFNAPVRNPRFTGRDESMSQLRSALRNRAGGGLPTVIQGTAGVGKTQIALEYAHRYRGAYDVVWWIAAGSPQYADTYLSDLGIQLKIGLDATSVDRARMMLQALNRGEPSDRWLIIFDSADDPAAIQNLLPNGRGHILITSRSSEWADRATPLAVEVFKRQESISHLRLRLETLTPEEAGRIAEALGDLPIAIAASGALLAESGRPVQDYLRQLEAGVGRTEAVQRNWDLSLDQLQAQSAAAYRLLQLCSVMAPEVALNLVYSEQMAAVLRTYDPKLLEPSMLATLVQHINRLSLLKLDPPNGQILFHLLLQDVVRERMTQAELDAARGQVHSVLAAARPRGEVGLTENWPAFRPIWPHLLISQAMTCDDKNVRDLFIDRLRYLWLSGDLSQGEEFGRLVSDGWGKMLREDPRFADDAVLRRQLLHLRFNLANVLRSMARYDESFALDTEVRQEQIELLGPTFSHTLMTNGSLAADLRGLGRYAESLVVDTENYQSWSTIFGEDHSWTLAAANNLATSYRNMGDFREAIRLDEDTFQRRRTPNPYGFYTMHSASCLGRDYRDAGEYEKSVALLRGVYEDICRVRGADTVEAMVAQANLAVSLRSAGQAHEAMPMLNASFDYLQSKTGPTSAETEACRLSRAVNFLAVRNNAAAEAEMRSIVAAYTDKLGEAHPHTLVCLSNLSAILRAQGEMAEAQAVAQRAADELATVVGMKHPFSHAARVNLAICLAQNSDLDQARTVLAETLDWMIATMGAEHPDTLRCQANLALVLREQGSTSRAADADVAVARLAKAIGASHPTVVALRGGRYAHRVIDPHPF